MRTLAVIPARLGATRLPRKPLRLLAGLPLVVRVWQRVQRLGVADRCVIATESPEVVQAARDAGADVALTDAGHQSGTDPLAVPHVVKVVADDDGRAMYFSRAPVPFLRDEAERPLLEARAWQHVGVYAYTRDALARWVALPPHPLEQIERLEQLRPLAAGMAIGVAMIAEPPRTGVDTEEELARANADWESFAGADQTWGRN